MADRDRKDVGSIAWRRRPLEAKKHLCHPLHLRLLGFDRSRRPPLTRAGGLLGAVPGSMPTTFTPASLGAEPDVNRSTLRGTCSATHESSGPLFHLDQLPAAALARCRDRPALRLRNHAVFDHSLASPESPGFAFGASRAPREGRPPTLIPSH